MDFDLDGARKAGYSDSEIADGLAPKISFDIDGARKAGYSDREIVDALTASPKFADYAKSFASGALSGTGMIAQGGGELVARAVNAVTGTQTLRAMNPMQPAIDWLRESQSPAAKREVANTQIGGSLFDSDTWSFGADPSLKGLALQGLDAIGQFAPNLAIAIATGGVSVPAQLTIGATVGGLQALGGGAEEERTKFNAMGHDELMGASKLYREFIGKGVKPDVAKNAVAEAAALGGGIGNAIPSAAEGAFENFLIGALTRGKLKIPNAFGTGVAGKVVTGVVGGGLTGGAEEAIEQMGQNVGANLAVGGNRPITADTLGQFVMGAIAEGVAGGGAATLQHVFPPQTATQKNDRVTAEGVGRVVGAKSVEDAIRTASIAADGPVFESDVATSVFGEGVISQAMGGAVARAERAMREQPAYDQVQAGRDRDFNVMENERTQRLAGLDAEQQRLQEEDQGRIARDRLATQVDAGAGEGIIAQALRRAVGGAERSPEASDAWGRHILQQMEQQASSVDQAAHVAATSPKNDLTEPSDPQKDAGNYQKGHARVAGLEVSIENPAGSKRRPEWPQLHDHYGYIRGVAARAPDKEHVDVFIKPGTADDFDGTVFVVDQFKKNGTFDEPKAVIGATNVAEAAELYRRNYSPDWDGGKKITVMSMDSFKHRLQDPNAFMRPQRDALDMPARVKPVESAVRAAGQAPESATTGAETDQARGPQDAAGQQPGAKPTAAATPFAVEPAAAPAKPVLILGKRVDQMTRKALEVSAKRAKSKEQRAAAAAELERRDDEAAARPVSDAEKARRDTLSRQAQAKKKIDVDLDSLIPAIIKLGGIKTSLRKEVLGEDKGNRGMLGVGYLFTPKGRNLDVLAIDLSQYGYITKAELEDDGDTGAVRLLTERIEDEYAGSRSHWSVNGNAAERRSAEQYAADQAQEAESVQAAAGELGADVDLTIDPAEMAAEGAPSDAQAVAIAELVERAERIQPGVAERFSMQYETDDAYLAALVQFLKERERAAERVPQKDHQVRAEEGRAAAGSDVARPASARAQVTDGQAAQVSPSPDAGVRSDRGVPGREDAAAGVRPRDIPDEGLPPPVEDNRVLEGAGADDLRRGEVNEVAPRRDFKALIGRYKPGNPFAQKAAYARLKYERLVQPTAHEKAMEQSFPLGGGFGRSGGEKKLESRINRAVDGEQARSDAEYNEARAAAFDRGEINAQGRNVTPESQARSEKREVAQQSRDERIARAKEQRGEKPKWQVPVAVWADSTGNLGGGARKLIEGEHREAIEKALQDGKPVPADVLADYPDLKTAAPLELAAQTEQDLRAKEARAADETAGDKALADRERDAFALTSPVPPAEAGGSTRNQSDLFGAAGLEQARQRREEAAAAVPSAPLFAEEKAAASPANPVAVAAEALAQAANALKAAAEGKPAAAPAPAEKPAVAETVAGALGAHDAAIDKARDGTLAIGEFKAAYEKTVANKDRIIAELEELTKDELNRRMGVRRNDRHGQLVRLAYSDMLSDFTLSRGFSYTMGQGSMEKSIAEMVEKTTAADLADYAERVKNDRAEREQRHKDVMASIENPQTLEDFLRFLKVKKESDLTPEQLRRFDDLAAARGRERRAETEASRSRVQAAGEAVGAQIIETKHTKKGHDLFVVQLEKRVEREDYNRLNVAAKRLGGYYSSFRGSGAVIGFQFTTRENAEAFQKLADGDTTAATDAVQERRATNRAEKKNAAAERLATMADRMEAAAQERMSAERLTNTARRARMASSAEAQAAAEERMAKTLRAISDAIEEGRATNLDGIRNRRQVEELESVLRSAKYEAIRAETQGGQRFEEEKDRAPKESDVTFAKYPRYTGSRSDFAAAARRVVQIPGAKMAGEKLLKMTDDAKDYAKDVGSDLSILQKVLLGKRLEGTQEGVNAAALFKTKGEAEGAVRRSNMRHSAMVVPLSGRLMKGQYAVVLGPAEAKGRGLWQPKEDPKLSIPADLMEEIIEKVDAENEGLPAYAPGRVHLGYYFEHVRESRARLKSMGIENTPELRAALREYIDMRAADRARDRVKELERGLAAMGDVGIDFFPTPAPLAARMAEALELKPGMTVLEPSGGKGNLADAVRAAEPRAEIDVVEQSPALRNILEAKGYPLVGSDFMDFEPEEKYDRVIMNPPFSKGMDAEHIERAYGMLKPGGKLVAISGEGIFFRNDSKAKAFREWFDQVGGTSEEMEDAFTDRREVRTTQVRSRLLIIDKPGDEKPLYSRAAAPVFYSELAGALEKKNTGTAHPEQWKAIIKGLPGVKADEVEWSGVLDWLGMQGKRVTRDQVLDYLQNNGVRVEETLLGAPTSGESTATSERDTLVVELDALGYSIETAPEIHTDEDVIDGITHRDSGYFYPVDSEGLQEGMAHVRPENLRNGEPSQETAPPIPQRVREMVSRLLGLELDLPTGEGSTAKFSKYTLPGGENYRELLLTLPAKPSAPHFEPSKVEIKRHLASTTQGNTSIWYEGKKLVEYSDDPTLMPGGAYEQKPDSYWLDVARGLFDDGDRINMIRPMADGFHSSHFDQPNILAHVRFNERSDAEGKKVLFIEEVQSDWAQKGKREGFDGDEKFKLVDADGSMQRGSLSRAEADTMAAERPERGLRVEPDIGRPEMKLVPRAPFVGKTEAWVGLALKRMVRWAAENGFDRVSWTTGEQQADRYDLSKHVNRVVVERAQDGTYMLRAIQNGEDVIGRSNLAAADLADLVGKDLADRIVKDVDRPGSGKTYSGLDLKIGGEGMRAFYDTIVPQVANSVLKKLGGERVSTVVIPRKVVIAKESKANGGGWYVADAGKSESAVVLETDFKTKEAAEKWAAENGRQTSQPGFDITPALRERALAGVPMFSRGGAGRGLHAAHVQSIADEVTGQMRNVPGVRVVATQSDIPGVGAALQSALKGGGAAAAREAMGLLERPIEGAYVNGEIYLVAENLPTEKRVREVLAHEAVGHLSVEQMLEQAKPGLMGQFVRQVQLLDKGGNRYIRTLAAQVDQRQPGLAAEARAKEIVALVAERGDQAKDMSPAVRSLWQKIVDAIKAFYKLVFGTDINDQDVRDIVAMAERWAQGEPHVTAVVDGKPSSEPLLSAGEAQAPDFAHDANGRPLLGGAMTKLVDPQNLGLDFGVRGGNVFQHKIVAADGTRILGQVTLLWDGKPGAYGKIRELWHITTLRNLRGLGLAEDVVKTILEHNVEKEIRALSVLPKARRFWENMGAEFVETEKGEEDGFLTLEKYRVAAATRAAEKAGGSGPAVFSRKAPVGEGQSGPRAPQEEVTPRSTLFSRAPAIAESATTGDTRDTLGAGAASFVRDMLHSDAKFNFWHKTIGTQQHKALVNPQFARVYDEGQAFLADVSKFANEAADMAQDLLPRVDIDRGLMKSLLAKSPSKQDLEATVKALYAGTLWGGGSPAEGRIWTDAELKSGRAVDGRVSIDVFEPLTDKQVELYRESLSSIAKSLDAMGTSLIHRLARQYGIGFDRNLDLEDVASSVREQVQDSIDDINLKVEAGTLDADQADTAIAALDGLSKSVTDVEQKTVALRDHGYFPAMRFGQFAVHVVRDVPGQETPEQLYFGLFESQTKANLAARELEKEFPDARIERGIVSKEQHRLFQGLSLDALEAFAEYVTDENGNAISKDPLVQGFLKAAVAERSALKRHIHRKGIAGFSDDLPRVLASFTVSTARATSSNYHGATMAKMANEIRDGDVKDEAIKLVRYLQDPMEEAQAVRGFLFAQFLGGSIAHGLVNMTQPFMVTIPYLSQHTSAADAAAQVAKAATTKVAGLTGKLKAAYERAKKDGIVAPQEIHQLRAETGGLPIAKNLALRKLSFLWGSIYAVTEQFNRTTAFLAAYRIAEAKGMADPYTFAAKAVNETQFVYNKGNRPNWARGPLLATMFTFKQFSISYLELGKRIFAKDRKAFALMALMLLAGAGIQGLPFAEDIEDLVDTIGQWMGFATNTKKALRRWAINQLGPDLAQVALHGVSGLPWMPVDVSNRLGLQNLIPGTGLLKLSEENKARDVLELVGPIGQFVPTQDTMAGKALERISKGDVFGALKGGAPVAVQNVLKGAEMLDTGEARDTKGKRVSKVTPAEAVLKIAGLQPASVARESEKIGIVQQDINLQKRMDSEIAEKWARGIADSKPDEVRDAQRELMAWNRDNPELKVRLTMEQIRRRVKEMRTPREERILKSAPREIRSAVRDELR